jgi:hypothetical protein
LTPDIQAREQKIMMSVSLIAEFVPTRYKVLDDGVADARTAYRFGLRLSNEGGSQRFSFWKRGEAGTLSGDKSTTGFTVHPDWTFAVHKEAFRSRGQLCFVDPARLDVPSVNHEGHGPSVHELVHGGKSGF